MMASPARKEKARYIPGIYDSVELVLSGTPHVERVQAVPLVEEKAVRVAAVLKNAGPAAARAALRITVREAAGGKEAGAAASEPLALGPGEERTVDLRVPIAGCRPWSPEAPFLYELEASTGADAARVRFGVRSFGFDPATKRAILNGRPYYLRGTNVCIFRFFEDAKRGDKPWNEAWVRRLIRGFRGMHWNSARFCIGFPPELWYRIADEEGFMVQDEFPIWRLKADVTAESLAVEYTEWMQDRWNHPCVVIWDAQNETRTEVTGKALSAVRGLDLSGRPWDNGWGPPQAPTDVWESHPYLFSNKAFRLSQLATRSPAPGGNPVPNAGGNPIIINEYGWMWLNRDGTRTTLSVRNQVYERLLGPDPMADQLRTAYARTLAAKTEWWRSGRQAAGVLHFCGLGYSRPDGETSDNFIDIDGPTFEPHFKQYVGDAFAPVGLMVDEWAEELAAGAACKVPVAVINDLDAEWQGPVTLRIVQGGRTVWEKSQPCKVAPLGREVVTFDAAVPAAAGRYELVGELKGAGGQAVRSLRDFAAAQP
jgi:hypothetical protein